MSAGPRLMRIWVPQECFPGFVPGALTLISSFLHYPKKSGILNIGLGAQFLVFSFLHYQKELEILFVGISFSFLLT